jgi:uncharacterized membrane protein (DUF485 family)
VDASSNTLQEHEVVDWQAVERSPEFQALVSRKRRFVLGATIFFLVYYSAFILLCGYEPGFMGESVYEGLTVGYVLALTQFIMVWGLGFWYLRKADREFEPLEQKVIEEALAMTRRTSGAAGTDAGDARVGTGSVR